MIRFTGKRGITLVEVMVATVVAFLLLISIYRVLSVGVRSVHTGTSHLEAMQVAQAALEFIETDLRGMILRKRDDPMVIRSMEKRNTLSFYVSRTAPDQGLLKPVYRGEEVRYELTVHRSRVGSTVYFDGTDVVRTRP